MGLLLPIILASFVLLQVFDTELGKPKSTENSEVTTSEIQTSEEKSAKIENDVAINEPKEEVKVVEPEEVVKAEEPKEEVTVVEPKEEIKTEESNELVKAEKSEIENSSDQKSETVSQDVNNTEEQDSDFGHKLADYSPLYFPRFIYISYSFILFY